MLLSSKHSDSTSRNIAVLLAATSPIRYMNQRYQEPSIVVLRVRATELTSFGLLAVHFRNFDFFLLILGIFFFSHFRDFYSRQIRKPIRKKIWRKATFFSTGLRWVLNYMILTLENLLSLDIVLL